MNLLEISEPNQQKNLLQEINVVGIDLGTTNSLICYVENGKTKLIGDITPSVVAYSNGNFIVGELAKNYDNAIYSVKRLMGKNHHEANIISQISRYESQNDEKSSLIINNSKFSPEEISAKILLKLKYDAENFLQKEVTKAVITVPAYFDENARNATKNAAKLAGLEVLRLINEPTAAAVAYGIDNHNEGKFIVYDLGGGTFDISILDLQKGVFQVLATSGDTNLGGDDFDILLLKFLITKHQFKIDLESLKPSIINNLLKQVKIIKEDLSSHELIEGILDFENHKLSYQISQIEFENIINDLCDHTIKIMISCIDDAKLYCSDIDGIILVGGSTRIPLIKKKIAAKFKSIIYDNVDPDKIVAIGAAIQAANLSSGQGNLLLDVIPLSLGIEVMGGIFEKLINRNSTIPFSTSKEFTTYEDGQTSISIRILQGEREMAKDCRELAHFKITNIPPMPAGAARISINFNVDADGLLTVTALEKNTKKKQIVEIKPAFGLTQDKIEQMLMESYHHAEIDINQKKLQEAKINAKNLIKELRKLLLTDKNLITSDEMRIIDQQIEELTLLVNADNADNILEAISKLKKSSGEFVNKKFDSYFKSALKGMSIEKTKEQYS